MRDAEHRCVGKLLADRLLDQLVGARVDVGRALVHHDHPVQPPRRDKIMKQKTSSAGQQRTTTGRPDNLDTVLAATQNRSSETKQLTLARRKVASILGYSTVELSRQVLHNILRQRFGCDVTVAKPWRQPFGPGSCGRVSSMVRTFSSTAPNAVQRSRSLCSSVGSRLKRTVPLNKNGSYRSKHDWARCSK